MRIVLFCENKYAVAILHPIHEYAYSKGTHKILWYVHAPKFPEFPLKDEVEYTTSIQEVYDFSPEAIFVPGNIVPYYLPGVKIQVFHGYAGEKKGHFIIRHYFDTYFTQGPFFTKRFKELAEKHKNFEVVETGWPKQDWIKKHLHDFDNEKKALLQKHGKSSIVLYAPTFSPKLTSLNSIKEALVQLVHSEDIILMMKFHPLTAKEWVEEYKQLAATEKNILWVDDFSVTKYQLMADLMISDTSSTVYEFLLLNKPVVTLKSASKHICWSNIQEPQELHKAYTEAISDKEAIARRRWIIENYDPYLDGKVAERMLSAAEDYIKRYGVPTERKVNLWRKYTSIKTFGRIKRK
ncbi:MAG: CDP-glycerol glycerophosphotransferase family protein [Bacteroidaceae bacterium]|nr:CDP-glycerol glycerophosphotransferase family protein [Bacteroidaceae bacterium]MBQ6694206.1 CDP-glycerol glycerophosphotransferase family protein [Bacteroidaceae bacterium]MBR7166282.1 CDP-glycerol glycerophosphotransferase family protein [Bacteroidaceae bacterium]